jgi:hypothetical protein
VAALVLLRARQRSKSAPASLAGARDVAERTLRDLSNETRKLLGDG